MIMPTTKILDMKIPKINTDKVYVLKEDGSLKLERWCGTYSDFGIIQIGIKDKIPVIRDVTIYDIIKII